MLIHDLSQRVVRKCSRLDTCYATEIDLAEWPLT
jgi:hypothetical protein